MEIELVILERSRGDCIESHQELCQFPVNINTERPVESRKACFRLAGRTPRQQAAETAVQLRGRMLQTLFQEVIGDLVKVENRGIFRCVVVHCDHPSGSERAFAPTAIRVVAHGLKDRC
jgi:hypothetical protein